MNLIETKQAPLPGGHYSQAAVSHGTEFINVSPLHTIYFEECGNPNGKSVLFIHGDPGSGTRPLHRTYFDPLYYRIILVDQRGCGKSTPHAETQDNTLQNLISDFEKIRKLLKIDQ